jgi:hypothetical protein
MNAGDKEPVVLAGGISALLGAIAAWVTFRGWITSEEAALLITIVTVAAPIIGALWARTRVASEHTIEKAGSTLVEVKEVADDPNITLVPKIKV